ncbi:hypothetical protein [Microbacterium xylanilyticum]
MSASQHTPVRIAFVDFVYARGHTGKVPIVNWALNRLGVLFVNTDPGFTTFTVVDEWEDEIRPREDSSGLDIELENWGLNFDIIVSWNGLFGDYLPLARLSDEVAGIVPLSVDLQRQLSLDVEDVFPAKKAWPGIGLGLEQVYSSFGDEFDIGRKYRGDSTLDDCFRIFSIYRRLLAGEPLRYEHVVRRGPVNIVDDRALIAPSARTLAAMRGEGAMTHGDLSDIDWSRVHLPESVIGLLDGMNDWDRVPVLRFALQMLAPTVNERLRAQLRDGATPSPADLERLKVALEMTP